MIAGVAAYVKYLRPEVRIIGVEPEGSTCLLAALRAGERVAINTGANINVDSLRYVAERVIAHGAVFHNVAG